MESRLDISIRDANYCEDVAFTIEPNIMEWI